MAFDVESVRGFVGQTTLRPNEVALARLDPYITLIESALYYGAALYGQKAHALRTRRMIVKSNHLVPDGNFTIPDDFLEAVAMTTGGQSGIPVRRTYEQSQEDQARGFTTESSFTTVGNEIFVYGVDPNSGEEPDEVTLLYWAKNFSLLNADLPNPPDELLGLYNEGITAYVFNKFRAHEEGAIRWGNYMNLIDAINETAGDKGFENLGNYEMPSYNFGNDRGVV